MARIDASTLDTVVPSQTVTQTCSSFWLRESDGISAQTHEGEIRISHVQLQPVENTIRAQPTKRYIAGSV